MKKTKTLLKLLGAKVLLCISLLASAQQTKTIEGKVTDEANQALPGATVRLKGTSTATATDASGNFSFKVPSDGATTTITVALLGYTTKEISVEGSRSVNINLMNESKGLNEVIVTGYAKQKREAVTGSIAQISGEKLNDVTTPNAFSLLQGKVAGVSVVNSSGRPGAAPSVRIRGRVSINSTLDPLYVIDGVVQHGTPNISPDDIETMSVLKDASATALYGSRGANGVVVVTTKSAKPNTSNISVSAKAGMSSYTTGKFKLMNSQDLVNLYQSFGNPTAIPTSFSPALANQNTDWQAIGSQTAPSQEYNVAYQGSSDKTKVFASGNYFNEEGTIKGYNYERYSARLNLDHKISERLTFSPKISGTYTRTENREHSVYDMYRNMPWDNPYGADGSIVNPQVPGTAWFGRDLNNYLYNLQWNYSGSRIANLLVNGDLSYQITKDFAFKSTNSVTYYHADGDTYVDPRSTNGLADNGRLTNTSAKRITRFTNQMLTYNRSFNGHSIGALAAYEYSDYKYSDMSATGKGIVPGISILTGTSSPTTIAGTANEYAFQSLLFNGNYDYKDRYFAQFSFRRDGSSRFGENNLYGNFFSVGGAWNVSKEDFFKSKAFDYLRLKASYGGVGNTPSDLYGSYSLYSISAQYNGVPTAFPTQLGNSNITWEQTYDANAGLEFGLLGRINATVEFYQKRTSNLLSSVPIAIVSGYPSYLDNIGNVKNTGIEVTLGGSVFKSETGFNWNLEVNWGKNVNRITKLFSNDFPPVGNFIYREGFDIGTFYMKKWSGVNPETGNPQWELVNPQTGEITNTGNYNAATLQMAGRSTPDFFGGINSEMNYKGFSLRTTFAFSKGAKIYNSSRETFDADGAYPTYNQMQLKDSWSRWTPENTNATHPRPLYGGNNNSNKLSTRYLEDASFFRMRNTTLAYQLPKSLIEKIKVKGASLYIAADNLFTITGFSGLDPETVDYALPKRFMFGVNINL